MIPGLENAEFVRFGVMHRNTFLESPKLLLPTLQFLKRESLLAAGQITGTEGYAAAAAYPSVPVIWPAARSDSLFKN